MKKSITYFENPGEENTDELIKLVIDRLNYSKIKYIAVASVTGKSILKLIKELENSYEGNLKDLKIINVSHHAGFKKDNELEIDDETRLKLEKKGIITYVGSHALSGVGRGISNKFGGVTPVEIIAATLRMFSQGIKVCGEISIMLADSGLIPVGENIIAIGGTGKGFDTATILTPANMTKVFDMKFHEIIAIPLP
ncbi:MAG: hypothetical protein LBM96_07465 [Methanobrevibacter sp.]|jgi:hypothetical protein|nr:hypothetical protein [Candidatus Methanoflexus mossambicus]